MFFTLKSSAKLLQNFELCKFFDKKIYLHFSKVVQNKNANCSFTAVCIFLNVQKFSEIKSFQQTSLNEFGHLAHCTSRRSSQLRSGRSQYA